MRSKTGEYLREPRRQRTMVDKTSVSVSREIGAYWKRVVRVVFCMELRFFAPKPDAPDLLSIDRNPVATP